MEYSSKKEIGKIILVVAAHPDDEVLGCGASIAKWTASGHIVHVLIMAEGATSRGQTRDRKVNSEKLSSLEKSANRAGKILGVTSVKLLNFPDNRMDSVDRLDIIKAVEEEIARLKPHTVITHHCGDVNIDHRITHEAVITACRPQPSHSVKLILAFEIVSSTEWQTIGSNFVFQPNWFENVAESFELKIKALGCYQSEMREWPHQRYEKNIKNLAQYRASAIGFEVVESFMLLRSIN